MGYQGWDEILMITLISSKKLGVYKIMRNTVCITKIMQEVDKNWDKLVEKVLQK